MKLLTKTLMASALLAISTAWGDFCSTNPFDISTPKYERVIILSSETPHADSNHIDNNHEAMIASDLYSAADAEAMTQNAIADFKATYGFDFGPITPELGTGRREIPGIAEFFPTKIGENKDIFLVTDSDHVDRSTAHAWYYLEFGNRVRFLSDGTVPGGTNAGHSFKKGDVYTYSEANLLKNNSDLQRPLNREVLNQFLNIEIHMDLVVLDDTGKQGINKGSKLVVRGATGDIDQFRSALFWYCPPQAE